MVYEGVVAVLVTIFVQTNYSQHILHGIGIDHLLDPTQEARREQRLIGRGSNVFAVQPLCNPV